MSIERGATLRVWLDGRRLADGTVSVPWNDPSLASGLGAFETLAIVGGTAPALDAHLRRLAQSCDLLHLPVPGSSVLQKVSEAALADWPHVNGVMRIQVLTSGHTLVAIAPAGPPRERIHACMVTWPAPPFPPSRAKHTSRAGAMLAPAHHKVDEVIRIDRNGDVLEGTWSNVFYLERETIRTCPDDGRILPGITRAAVLDLARTAGLRVVEVAPLADAEGGTWLLSSSLAGLRPVEVIDGRSCPAAPSVVQALQTELCAAGLCLP